MYAVMLMLIVLLFPSAGFAAYNSATVVSNELKEDGRTRLVFRFTGNAGEPSVIREYFVNASSTATVLRNWVDGIINELNLMRSAATLPALQIGQTVTPLAPTAPAAPTAKQIWLGKVDRYNRFVGLGLTGTAATDLAALLADINATYVTGYLQ